MFTKGKRWWIAAILAIVLVVVMISLFRVGGTNGYRETSYSELMDAVRSGNVRDVTMKDCAVTVHLDDGTSYHSETPCEDKYLIDALVSHGAQVRIDRSEPDLFLNWALYWIPSLLMIGLYVYYLRAMLRALNDNFAKLAALRTEISQSQTERQSS